MNSIATTKGGTHVAHVTDQARGAPRLQTHRGVGGACRETVQRTGGQRERARGGGGGLLREHCPVTTLLLPIAAPPPRGGILHPNTKAAPLLRAHPTPFPASYASGGGEGARAPQEEAQGAREDTQARPRQGAPQGPPHTYYLTAHYCTTYYLLLIPTQGFVNPPLGFRQPYTLTTRYLLARLLACHSLARSSSTASSKTRPSTRRPRRT